MKSLDELANSGTSHFGPAGMIREVDWRDEFSCVLTLRDEALMMRNFVCRIPSAVGHLTLQDGSRWECHNREGFVRWVAVPK